MGIKKIIKKHFYIYNFVSRIKNGWASFSHAFVSDKHAIEKKWKKVFGTKINLNNPSSINEKIQWLKLNDRKDIYTLWADKFKSKDYISNIFGEQYVVPLLFATDNVNDINDKNINKFPCVIKANHTSGDYLFLKNKEDVDWKKVRAVCKTWLKRDYYAISREWQYKNIKRYIIVEDMLLTKNNSIPNDYKLHFIEGKLAFIYCSIDREGDNYRQIYDKDWKLLPFRWDGKKSQSPIDQNRRIPKPSTLEKMIEIGNRLAKDMHYIRVDFYDVDGKLYCGEITLHHGGGFDRFDPEEYDYKYGALINL